MRTAVLVNTHSRQARQNIKIVKRYFAQDDCPFEIIDFVIIENLDDFQACLTRIQKIPGIQCVIIGSGDGTIIAALNALKNKNVVYGFIPLGTGNTFVRSLGIPLDIKKSLRVLGQKHIRRASIGKVNDNLFVNSADIGVPVQVVDNITDKLKRRLGSLAYVVSGIRELVRHDPIWCQLDVDGKKLEFRSHHIQFNNGDARVLGTNKDVVATAYEDHLTITYSTSLNRWEYVKDALGFIVGRPEKREHLHYLSAKKIKLTTTPQQTIQADGEIIDKTPATIQILKDAIRVFAPEPEKPSDKKRIGRRSRS